MSDGREVNGGDKDVSSRIEKMVRQELLNSNRLFQELADWEAQLKTLNSPVLAVEE